MEATNRFLSLFETANSKVVKKDLFSRSSTRYIPDFFFVSFYVTLLSLSGILDRVWIILIFYYQHHNALAVFYSVATVAPFLYILMLLDSEESTETVYAKRITFVTFRMILTIFGLDAITLASKIIKNELHNKLENTENTYKLNSRCFTFFNISEINLSFLKTHCLVNTVLKCIPQLYIIPVYLWVTQSSAVEDVLALISIFLNMVIFSFTIAATVPIRKKPRVFSTSKCVVLNSFSKFMATMCSCGVVLLIFTAGLNSIGYYALLLLLERFLFSIWPAWHSINSLPEPFNSRTFCGVIFLFIFGFIYVHPFEGIGKLFYYYYYLMTFFIETGVLYLLTNSESDYIFIYLSLKVTMLGFLSVFGLLNMLKKEQETFFGKGGSGTPTMSKRNEKNLQKISWDKKTKSTSKGGVTEKESEVEPEEKKKMKKHHSDLPASEHKAEAEEIKENTAQSENIEILNAEPHVKELKEGEEVKSSKHKVSIEFEEIEKSHSVRDSGRDTESDSEKKKKS